MTAAPLRAARNQRETTWTRPAHPPAWKKRFTIARAANQRRPDEQTDAERRDDGAGDGREHETPPADDVADRPHDELAEGVAGDVGGEDVAEARLAVAARGGGAGTAALTFARAEIKRRVADEEG